MTERRRFRMSSTVFIVLRQGDMFCSLRRVATGWMDGHFSVPAGAVEEGESLLAAALREAQEEVGVVIEVADLRYAHTLHCRTRGEGWVGHFFVAERWQGTPMLGEPEKHGDLHWASFQALPEPFVPYVRNALLGIAAGETYSEYGYNTHFLRLLRPELG